MEFDEVLALRKSVRRYTKEIVSQEDEKAILDAAMASSVGKHNDGGYAFWCAPSVSDLPHEGSGGLSHAV